MKLRPELTPPALDESTVQRLAELADEIDGARPGEWEDQLDEFNRLANTSFPFEIFQGIYGGEEHECWVRRVLWREKVKPVPDITREELIEVARRAMDAENYPANEAYMAIFDANVPLESASNLIYYPLDYDTESNTWGAGRPMSDYNPTPEQIVDWALSKQAQITHLFLVRQIRLGDHGKSLGVERFHAHLDVIDHQGDGGPAVRPHDQGVGLDDVHLGLQ